MSAFKTGFEEDLDAEQGLQAGVPDTRELLAIRAACLPFTHRPDVSSAATQTEICCKAYHYCTGCLAKDLAAQVQQHYHRKVI